MAKRAAIVFAGPAINFLFAIILLFGMYTFYGQPVTPPMASAVIAESAADKGGIQPHDKILSIDWEKINRFEDWFFENTAWCNGNLSTWLVHTNAYTLSKQQLILYRH